MSLFPYPGVFEVEATSVRSKVDVRRICRGSGRYALQPKLVAQPTRRVPPDLMTKNNSTRKGTSQQYRGTVSDKRR